MQNESPKSKRSRQNKKENEKCSLLEYFSQGDNTDTKHPINAAVFRNRSAQSTHLTNGVYPQVHWPLLHHSPPTPNLQTRPQTKTRRKKGEPYPSPTGPHLEDRPFSKQQRRKVPDSAHDFFRKDGERRGKSWGRVGEASFLGRGRRHHPILCLRDDTTFVR